MICIPIPADFTDAEARLLGRGAIYYEPNDSPCAYLPERTETARYYLAAEAFTPEQYESLIGFGWRRSGRILYKNRCRGCAQCVPVKLAVAEFRSNRSQRRNLTRNRDLKITVDDDTSFAEEDFALFARYSAEQHEHTPSPEMYRDFLCSCPYPAIVIRYRDGARLLGIAWCDRLPHSLSAVYCAYDPAAAKERAPGVFSILFECSYAQQLGLRDLHLGFRIDGCRKMCYKSHFRPLQQSDGNGVWRVRPPETPKQ